MPASYLAQVQTIQRSQGRSVVAAAAYSAGASLTDERLAMEFDPEFRLDERHQEVQGRPVEKTMPS